MNSQHLRENNLINPTIYTNYDDIPAALLFQPPNHQTHGRRLESWEFLHQELHWRPEIWTCTKTFLGNKEKVISTELRSLRLGSEFTIKWTYGLGLGLTYLWVTLTMNKQRNCVRSQNYNKQTEKSQISHWLYTIHPKVSSSVKPLTDQSTALSLQRITICENDDTVTPQ